MRSPYPSVRGLDLFRRGLGALCLVDAALRLPDASFLYSDLGVLSRAGYYQLSEWDYGLSLFLFSGQPLFAALLLVTAAGLGVVNLLGRDSRLSRAALWALVLSVQVRNPLVCDSADVLLRLLLFWDIFLPDRGQRPGKAVCWCFLGQLSVAFVAVGLPFLRGETWTQAARWGGYSAAAAFPWFGQVVAGALLGTLLALWWVPSRKVLFPPVLLVLGLWGVLLHPALPMVLVVALLSVWPGEPGPVVSVPRKQKILAGCALSLALASLVLPGPSPLAAPAQILGLAQSWNRVYPLPESRTVRLRFQAGQNEWRLLESRRHRLLAFSTLTKPGLSEGIARALAMQFDFLGRVEAYRAVDTRLDDLQVEGGSEVKMATVMISRFERPAEE